MLNGLDALYQVLQVLTEILQCLFELAPGLPQFGTTG
jgi:hypothetical protein